MNQEYDAYVSYVTANYGTHKIALFTSLQQAQDAVKFINQAIKNKLPVVIGKDLINTVNNGTPFVAVAATVITPPGGTTAGL